MSLLADKHAFEVVNRWAGGFKCDWCHRRLGDQDRGVGVHSMGFEGAWLRFHDDCFFKAIAEFFQERFPERCEVVAE